MLWLVTGGIVVNEIQSLPLSSLKPSDFLSDCLEQREIEGEIYKDSIIPHCRDSWLSSSALSTANMNHLCNLKFLVATFKKSTKVKI